MLSTCERVPYKKGAVKNLNVFNSPFKNVGRAFGIFDVSPAFFAPAPLFFGFSRDKTAALGSKDPCPMGIKNTK